MNSTLLRDTQVAAYRSARNSAMQAREEIAAALRPGELRFIWGFWIFIAVLTFANALMNDAMSATNPRLPGTAPLVAALVNCLTWAVLTPLMFRLTSRFSLDHPKWLLSLTGFLLLGIAVAVCVARFMSYVRYQQAIYYNRSAAATLARAAVDPNMVLRQVWFMKEFVIYLVVLAGGFAHDYFVRYRVHHEQARLLEVQAARFRVELADARLSALRSQINPHFLFNTLNTVSSLTERDPRGARRMIAQLSDLLRETLDQTDLEVALERELVTVRRYVEIMQARFRDQLEVTEDIESGALSALVPTLLLQPLVENAIKHGIEKLGGSGRIVVRARRSGQSLLLSVLNSGTDASGNLLQDTHDRVGLGLQNTRDRLAQSYGDQQSLLLSRHPDGGAAVEIVLPFHTAPLIAELPV